MSRYELDSSAVEKLHAFRSGNIHLLNFQSWVANSINLNSQIPQGILLKLKHGDEFKVMAAIANLIPTCNDCSQLPKPQEFSNRKEHSDCAVRVDENVSAGVLKKIHRPNWVRISGNDCQFGADAYYECTVCSSLWLLVEPERQENGLWARLA